MNEIEYPGKVSAFITLNNDKLHEKLVNLCYPKEVNKLSFIELTNILLSLSNKTTSVAIERYKFGLIRQDYEEPLKDLENRLRDCGKFCNFDKQLEDRLRDQFIICLNNDKFKSKCLEIKDEKYFTLSIKDLIIKLEAENIVNKLNPKHSQNEEIHFIKRNNKFHQFPQNKPYNQFPKCNMCNKGHQIDETCPAKGKTCYKCQKTGHFGICCKSKIDFKTKKDEVHFVDTEILNIQDQKITNNKILMVDVSINRNPIKLLVDTGAEVSILKQDIASELKLIIDPSNRNLSSYSGTKLEVKGQSKCRLKWDNISKEVCFQIIKSESKYDGLIGIDILNIFQKTIEINHLGSGKLNTGIKNFQAKIVLKEGTIPKFCKFRTVPYGLVNKLKEELDLLESKNILTKVNYSKWATPIVMIKKADNSYRICGDYKVTINPHIVDVNSGMLDMDCLLQEASDSSYFSKLDLEGAYLQLSLDSESQNLTTINTPFGLYRYNKLPFGIKTSPGIFQNVMLELTKDLPGIKVYLDDILVLGKTQLEHDKNLKAVTDRLNFYNAKLNNNKCIYNKTEIEYLGHIISYKKIEPNKNKVLAVASAKEPLNKKELQAWLGAVHYYGKFLKHLATKLVPLDNLLKDGVLWQWGDIEKSAWLIIKEALSSPLMLTNFDINKKTYLTCDASSIGIGGVLEQDGRPVYYISRKLSATEFNYSQIEKECLAIVWSIKRLNKFLAGNHFFLLNDHKPLKYLLNDKAIGKIATARVQRWAFLLSVYDFTFISKRSEEIPVADLLSRTATQDESMDEQLAVNFVFDMPVDWLKTKILKIMTNEEPWLTLKKYIINGWPAKLDFEELKPYYKLKHELTHNDGLIFKGNKVLIPPKLQSTVLNNVHNTHFGITATKNLCQGYFWPNINRDIEFLIKSCSLCGENKHKTSNKIEYGTWPLDYGPMERVHIDFAGPLNHLGGKYLFILVDSFSKWPEIMIVNDVSCKTVIMCLRKIFSRFGVAKTVVSDNGTGFVGEESRAYLDKIGCKHLTIAPYHPKSNGLAERMVQTIKSYLKVTLTSFSKFQEMIDKFLFIYRLISCNTTGASPSKLMLGRQMNSNLQLISNMAHVWQPSIKKYVKAICVGHLGNKCWLFLDCNGDVIKRHLEQIKWLPIGSNGADEINSDNDNNYSCSNSLDNNSNETSIHYQSSTSPIGQRSSRQRFPPQFFMHEKYN